MPTKYRILKRGDEYSEIFEHHIEEEEAPQVYELESSTDPDEDFALNIKDEQIKRNIKPKEMLEDGKISTANDATKVWKEVPRF